MAKAALLRVQRPVTILAYPNYEIDRTEPRSRETISSFLRRTGWASRTSRGWLFHNTRLPVLCIVNGELCRRRDWRRTRIRLGDEVHFVARPMGGQMSGMQIAGLVGLIALTAFAPYLGGLAVGAAFGSAAAAFTVGATGVTLGALAGAGIVLGGTLLLATLLRPKTADQQDGKPIDQLYTVSASGNLARPLQPIKKNYGRIKSFPDYLTTPWSEFGGTKYTAGPAGEGGGIPVGQTESANDQFLNLLMNVGLGEYDVHEMFIDDTPFWNSTEGILDTFDNVQVEFYGPGQNVTLFPINVVSAAEVSGQTLLGKTYAEHQSSPGPGEWIGGFIVAAAGTTTNTIALDFELPLGAFAEDADGMHSVSIPVNIEYRAVNNAGAPLESYKTLIDHTFTYATKTPQRETVKVGVASTPGARYQVRARKVVSEVNPSQPAGATGAGTVNWVGLRAFLANTPKSFAGLSSVAIRIKANGQLSSSGSHRFGVLRTCKLLVWNGSAWVLTATRNPLWAFYDMATNTDYGAACNSTKVDFSEIYAQALAADARGDTFDYEFTGSMLCPEAFDMILKPARCWHRWAGDVLSVVRDEWRAVPQLMLTDRELSSPVLDIVLNENESADAVIVEYLDEETWGPASVQYPPEEEVTSVNPSRRRIDGIVKRVNAYKEAAFLWKQSQKRRKIVTIDTEYDGRLVGLGSHVAVQSEMPLLWGSAGIVSSYSGNELTLSPAPAWALSGQHYINIRTKTGRPFGPIKIDLGDADEHGELDAADLAAVQTAQGMTLAQALARSEGGEAPSFSLGISLVRGIVLSGRPSGDHMQLVVALDTIDVHDGDIGATPATPIEVLPTEPRVPTIVGLNASFRQSVTEVVLHASWQPARGAKSYTAEVSYDLGVNWESIYEGTANNFSRVCQPANLRLRVQAISKATDRPGPSSTVNVTVPEIIIPEYRLAEVIRTEIAKITPAFKRLDKIVAVLSDLPAIPQIPNVPSIEFPDVNLLFDPIMPLSMRQLHQEVSERTLGEMLKTNVIDKTLREAGISIDPTTGRVSIRAVDQFRDEVNAYRSEVTADFDAVEASIVLRATYTDVADFASAIAAGFEPAYRYEYTATAEGWTGSSATLTPGATTLSVATTGAGAYLQSPTIALDADLNRLVQLRIRRTAGSGWGVALKWGASFANSKAATAPSVPTDWNTIVLMLDDEATWTGTLTALRLALDNASTFEIDYLQIGRGLLQNLALSGIDGRLSTAEISISGMQAEIDLRALNIDLSSAVSRVTTAELAISALEGDITLLATTAEVTFLGSTLSTVQVQLNSLLSVISFNIDLTREDPKTQDVADANIADLVMGYRDNADRRSATAKVGQTLSAKIDDNFVSTAILVNKLEVRSTNTEASLTQELLVRAAANSALAALITTLSVQVNDPTTGLPATRARLVTEEIVRATADTALSASVTTLDAQVNNVSTGLPATLARLVTEESARATSDSAIAASVTTLSAQVNNVTTGLPATLARLVTEESARATADTAIAASVTILDAQVNNVTTGLPNAHARVTTEVSARATADSALSASITTLDAQVNNVTTGLPSTRARLITEEQTRATSDTAIAATVTTLSAQVNDAATGLPNSHTRITTEVSARATADTALAGLITSLTTTVNGNTAGITSLLFSVDGTRVGWGIKATISGAPAGGMVFEGFLNPDGSIVKQLLIDGDVVLNGTLTGPKFQTQTILAEHIDVDELFGNAATFDQINVNHLTLGSVDITKIVSGSTSRIAHDSGVDGNLSISGSSPGPYFSNGTAQLPFVGSYVVPAGPLGSESAGSDGRVLIRLQVEMQISTTATNNSVPFWDLYIMIFQRVNGGGDTAIMTALCPASIITDPNPANNPLIRYCSVRGMFTCEVPVTLARMDASGPITYSFYGAVKLVQQGGNVGGVASGIGGITIPLRNMLLTATEFRK